MKGQLEVLVELLTSLGKHGGVEVNPFLLFVFFCVIAIDGREDSSSAELLMRSEFVQ